MRRWIALSLGICVASATARAEDLLLVYERALANDPQIREADANRLATREAKPQALSALLPQINGIAVAGKSDSSGSQAVFTGGLFNVVPFSSNPATRHYGVTLQQSVFSWANWMSLKAADSQVAQAEADYQAAQQQLISRVATQYFNVLAAQDNVDAQASALSSISRQLEQAEKRFEVGLIAITDVQEAKAARDSATAAVIDAKRQLASAEEFLREITGEGVTSLAKPAETMPLKSPDPIEEQKWVDVSMEQNATLLSSRLAADIARDNVRVAFGGHLPTLSLIGSKTKDKSNGPSTTFATTSHIDTTSDGTQIQLQLSVPLFAGGGTQSRFRQSEYLWQAARERFSRVSRQTERQARDAYLGVLSEISRVQALRQGLESSRTALKATEAGYEVGTRTTVDVLDARKNLVQAETNYARSRYDYIINVINLKLAAGSLNRRSVEEINGWLEKTPASPPSATPPATTPSATPATPKPQ